MIDKSLLQEVSEKYEPNEIEYLLFKNYITFKGLDIKESSILSSYFDNFGNVATIPQLNELRIWNIDELEKYMELLIPSRDRKLNGAHFTPRFIIDYMLGELDIKESDTIIDPSCGCGAFLINAIKYYKTNYDKSIKDTVRNNIYGVDILPYNVRRCKLLISILALGDNEYLEEDDFNIISENSLKLNWKNKFSSSIEKFDHVIGNPPYVKLQDLKNEDRNYLKSEFQTARNGAYNLYFAFFELGYSLLKDSGTLSYITPNNYFTSLAARPLRKYFERDRMIHKVLDFSHFRVFDAQTYTAITFINKVDNNNIKYERSTKKPESLKDLKNLNYSTVNYKDLDFKKWRLLKDKEQFNIKRIESIGDPLGELFDIYVGIATLKDSLYFLEEKNRKEGFYKKSIDSKDFLIEEEIVKEIYKISDFKNGEDLQDNSRRIIFPYSICKGKAQAIPIMKMEKKYPKCLKYFQHIKPKLNKRSKGKIDVDPFYLFGRSQGLNRFGPKVLTPTFSKYPRFNYVSNTTALFCNGYGIYFKDQKNNLFQNLIAKKENSDVLMKVLNSYVMHYYVKCTSVSIQGGYPCYQKNFIRRFNIPKLDDEQINELRSLDSEKEINQYLIELYQLNLSLPKRFS